MVTVEAARTTHPLLQDAFGGVTDEEVKIFQRIAAQQKYCFAITEKEGEERHIHWVWVTHNSKKVGNAKNPFYLAMSKQWREGTNKKVAMVVKIWYDVKVLEDYMTKDSQTCVVIHKQLPPDMKELDGYFPAKDDKRAVRKKFEDPWFSKQRDDFLEHWKGEYGAPTMRDVNLWFYVRMYVHLEVHVLSDPRKYKEKVRGIYHCIWCHWHKDSPTHIAAGAESAWHGHHPWQNAPPPATPLQQCLMQRPLAHSSPPALSRARRAKRRQGGWGAAHAATDLLDRQDSQKQPPPPFFPFLSPLSSPKGRG